MSYAIKLQLTINVSDEMVEAAREAFPELSEFDAVQRVASEEIAIGLVEGDDQTTIDSVEVKRVA